MQHLFQMDTVQITAIPSWEIVPRDWVENAKEKDLKYFN
jgi:hypothetical protein